MFMIQFMIIQPMRVRNKNNSEQSYNRHKKSVWFHVISPNISPFVIFIIPHLPGEGC